MTSINHHLSTINHKPPTAKGKTKNYYRGDSRRCKRDSLIYITYTYSARISLAENI